LNNSNDLFLTFRKEMEEMSKKTKRLEKENMQLTRKQEATKQNIVQMAEERSQSQQAIDRLTKQNEKLTELCREMQRKGYGRADLVAEDAEGDDDLGETESDYEDEDSLEGAYDEDTEEEQMETHPPPFGPVPPPPPPPQDLPNGRVRGQLNGVNGIKH